MFRAISSKLSRFRSHKPGAPSRIQRIPRYGSQSTTISPRHSSLTTSSLSRTFPLAQALPPSSPVRSEVSSLSLFVNSLSQYLLSHPASFRPLRILLLLPSFADAVSARIAVLASSRRQNPLWTGPQLMHTYPLEIAKKHDYVTTSNMSIRGVSHLVTCDFLNDRQKSMGR